MSFSLFPSQSWYLSLLTHFPLLSHILSLCLYFRRSIRSPWNVKQSQRLNYSSTFLSPSTFSLLISFYLFLSLSLKVSLCISLYLSKSLCLTLWVPISQLLAVAASQIIYVDMMMQRWASDKEREIVMKFGVSGGVVSKGSSGRVQFASESKTGFYSVDKRSKLESPTLTYSIASISKS